MLTASKLRGFTPVLATPLHEDESVDADSLQSLTSSTLHTKPVAIQILGSTGQGPTLPDGEHRRAIEIVVQHLGGQLPLIAGATGKNTQEIIENAQRSEQAGAAAVLVAAPSYFPVGDGDVLRMYERVANASAVPVIMYNIPARTGVTLTPKIVTELAAHPNILGMKDSSGNMASYAQIATNTSENEFALLQGRVALVLASMAVGGTGWMTTVGNVEPQLDREFLDAWEAGDYTHARACQSKMLDWAALFNHRGWDPATNVTALLSADGRCKNVLAHPIHALDEDEMKSLAELRNHRFG